MKPHAHRRLGRALLVVLASLAAACTDRTPVAPVHTVVANRLPDLAGCEQLAAPEGSTLVLKAYAEGVQVYRWNGASWGASVPSATLYANAQAQGVIGTHFGGPTWQGNSGGKVVGSVATRCFPSATDIPWLKLTAVSDGPGIFAKVVLIQRLNTVGGLAPSAPGSVVGEEARIPYTADYLFYHAP